MPTPLVAGYDSDSDDGESAIPSSNTIDIESKPISTKQILPPSVQIPTKKRHQIRIESLDSLNTKDEEKHKQKKKIKLIPAEKKPGGHSLLNMLPPPRNKDPILPNKKVQQIDSNLEDNTNNFGLQDSSSGTISILEPLPSSSTNDKAKPKGNNDFRAMLGLQVSSSNVKKDEGESVISNHSKDEEEKVKDESANDDDRERHYFISNTLPNTNNKQSLQIPQNSFAISSAPKVNDEQEIIFHDNENENQDKDPYSGWQQGPDGNWFPVTPEAHIQFQQYLADQQKSHLNDKMEITQSSSSSIEIDKKYAIAAASASNSGQNLIDLGSHDNEEERKKMDKSINLRAKRKGQLTSLIAQAEEKRDELEQKWAKGRSARNEARSKYGF